MLLKRNTSEILVRTTISTVHKFSAAAYCSRIWVLPGVHLVVTICILRIFSFLVEGKASAAMLFSIGYFCFSKPSVKYRNEAEPVTTSYFSYRKKLGCFKL